MTSDTNKISSIIFTKDKVELIGNLDDVSDIVFGILSGNYDELLNNECKNKLNTQQLKNVQDQLVNLLIKKTETSLYDKPIIHPSNTLNKFYRK